MSADLLDDLRDIRALIEDGDPAPFALIEAALERIPIEVDREDKELIRSLRDEVDAVYALIAAQQGVVGAELQRVTKGREMLKGYSSLRGSDQAQRLSRRA